MLGRCGLRLTSGPQSDVMKPPIYRRVSRGWLRKDRSAMHTPIGQNSSPVHSGILASQWILVARPQSVNPSVKFKPTTSARPVAGCPSTRLPNSAFVQANARTRAITKHPRHCLIACPGSLRRYEAYSAWKESLGKQPLEVRGLLLANCQPKRSIGLAVFAAFGASIVRQRPIQPMILPGFGGMHL